MAHWIKQHLLERYPEDFNEILYSDKDPKKRSEIVFDGNRNDKIIVDKLQLIANKCENYFNPEMENEVYSLGMGEPVYMSGEHGDNVHELYGLIDKLTPDYYKKYYKELKAKRVQKFTEIRKEVKKDLKTLMDENPDDKKIQSIEFDDALFEFDTIYPNPEDLSDLDEDAETQARSYMNYKLFIDKIGITTENYLKSQVIHLSVIGRPNAGKSTFINKILNQDRCLVSEIEGTTRDSIDIHFTYKSRKICLVDTAGILKNSRKYDHMNLMIYDKTIESLRRSQVCIILIDSLEAFRNWDFDLAVKAVDEGKC